MCHFPHLPPACDDDLRRSPILPLDACPSRIAPTAICTSTYVRSARSRFPSSPSRATTIDASSFRFLGPPSMQEHPCAPDALPTHTGSLTRSATGMHSIRRRPHLAPRSFCRTPAMSLCGESPARQPCGTSHPLFSASSAPASPQRGMRHPPRLPAAPAVAGDRLQHHHTARDSPHDYEPTARCARCTAIPMSPRARYSASDAVTRRDARQHKCLCSAHC
jgi:hypothetical protein